ncbi:hypothetical protein WMY93_007296 [Mugilogobius chulae]|uniref:Uncharacterized protein n=1 Tax=Mugilogobius chulae TaxID=88201 RepID=A0AAW0PCM8_9GOBI
MTIARLYHSTLALSLYRSALITLSLGYHSIARAIHSNRSRLHYRSRLSLYRSVTYHYRPGHCRSIGLSLYRLLYRCLSFASITLIARMPYHSRSLYNSALSLLSACSFALYRISFSSFAASHYRSYRCYALLPGSLYRSIARAIMLSKHPRRSLDYDKRLQSTLSLALSLMLASIALTDCSSLSFHHSIAHSIALNQLLYRVALSTIALSRFKSLYRLLLSPLCLSLYVLCQALARINHSMRSRYQLLSRSRLSLYRSCYHSIAQQLITLSARSNHSRSLASINSIVHWARFYRSLYHYRLLYHLRSYRSL